MKFESRPLGEFRDCSAYVLLGAPGAGKTEAFKQEAEEPAICDARDFITLDYQRWTDMRGHCSSTAWTRFGREPLTVGPNLTRFAAD